MRLHFNMRKNWNRLPRETGESPLLEPFKTHLDTFLSPAQGDPALAGGLDYDFQRSLATLTIL